jgi:hypothetical protein
MGRPEAEMSPGDNDGENLVHRCVEKKCFEKVACRQRGNEDSTAALTKGAAGYWRSVFTACVTGAATNRSRATCSWS